MINATAKQGEIKHGMEPQLREPERTAQGLEDGKDVYLQELFATLELSAERGADTDVGSGKDETVRLRD